LTVARLPVRLAGPLLAGTLLAGLLIAAPGETNAQSYARPDDGWNEPRVLELIERARHRRSLPQVDSGLVSYQARANGYVYFFLDREGESDADRTLVKVDQLALEVYWAAPNLTKQRIIGQREAKSLPSRIHYHLDHLTVIQNEFDDIIRMGDGDEVRAVVHPAAANAESFYDFRLADSLSIRLPGVADPIRVYEVEVRPRRPDEPGFIGSLFLDRASADIVRMTFTFTPASYVDPRLDYIRVSLDNGLWEGRYWLPNEQRVELRRQIPQLDVSVGTIIRGVFRVGDYRLNEPLPPDFFLGPRVVALPSELRERHPFEAGLFTELDADGLATIPELATLPWRARELIGTRRLSGLPRFRFYVPGASSVLRYNRAEGIYVGGGASYLSGAASKLDLTGGYAVGARHGVLAAVWRWDPMPGTRLRVRGERNALHDIGTFPGAAGLLNTLHGAVAGEDFLDPYHVDGVGIGLEHRLGGAWSLVTAAGVERHRSATLTEDAALLDSDARFRPIRGVDEGTLVGATLGVRRTPAAGRRGAWSAALDVEAGSLDDRFYVRPVLELSGSHGGAGGAATVELRARAGLALGDVPAQRFFLIGGRGTLPGHAYRAFTGDRFAILEAGAAHDLVAPWIRARAGAAIGWTGLDRATLPADWGAGATGGARLGISAGVGLFYDVLRLDLARGLRGGRWNLILSISPDLWDML